MLYLNEQCNLGPSMTLCAICLLSCSPFSQQRIIVLKIKAYYNVRIFDLQVTTDFNLSTISRARIFKTACLARCLPFLSSFIRAKMAYLHPYMLLCTITSFHHHKDLKFKFPLLLVHNPTITLLKRPFDPLHSLEGQTTSAVAIKPSGRHDASMLVFFSGHGTPWYLTLFIFAVSLASQGLDVTFFPYSLFSGPFVVGGCLLGNVRSQLKSKASIVSKEFCLSLHPDSLKKGGGLIVSRLNSPRGTCDLFISPSNFHLA